jgi:hypothetical protein
MSDQGIKYVNIYNRVCYSQKDDHSGAHVELEPSLVQIKNIGATVDINYPDIPWLIATLQDVLKQLSA